MSFLAFALLAAAQAGPSPIPDYAADASWLCRPGRQDACSSDQTATIVRANGTRAVERFVPAASPKFDCFYVYPTVSTDPTPNSDMAIDDAERRVATVQAARFASVCRVFAPTYRQVTLAALREVMTGRPFTADRAMAYADVKAAWNDYLKRDNGGRGVVLIGHSQGAGVLKELIAREIEGKPVGARIISAMLIGTNVNVPEGKQTGGDLKTMPLCTTERQTGCAVSYVGFRSNSPPPANSRFGRAPAGQMAACTNPAALGGGSAVMKAYLPGSAIVASSQPAPAWTKDGAPVTTPFVAVPGLLSAKCVHQDGASYLSVTVNADPADPRADDIAGDVVVGGTVLKDWGLHLIDMNIAMGDLMALAERQAAAWSATR